MNFLTATRGPILQRRDRIIERRSAQITVTGRDQVRRHSLRLAQAAALALGSMKHTSTRPD
jgi:hypothetical protein